MHVDFMFKGNQLCIQKGMLCLEITHSSIMKAIWDMTRI
jgi:hypothetical protein